MRNSRDGGKYGKNGKKKKRGGKKKEKRLMEIVATMSLPAVDRPNADHWNAARLCQNLLVPIIGSDLKKTIVQAGVRMCQTPCWVGAI